MKAQTNIHGTACVIGDRGFLITGPSGAGKSTLALALIDAATQRGQFAALISDDQAFLATHNGRIIASAPKPIAGKIEISCLGIADIKFCDASIIDYVIALLPQDQIMRLPKPQTYHHAGLAVPQFDLPIQSAMLNVQNIFHILAGKMHENP